MGGAQSHPNQGKSGSGKEGGKGNNADRLKQSSSRNYDWANQSQTAQTARNQATKERQQAVTKCPDVFPIVKCGLRLRRLQQIRDFLELEQQAVAALTKVAKAEDSQASADKLRGMPLVLGSLEEMVGESACIVSTSAGADYYVPILSICDKTALYPGATVLLHSKAHSVVGSIHGEVDPLLSVMKLQQAPQESYRDIGGLEDVIKELVEVVELPLTKPELFTEMGILPPKGILLYGPPGSGKCVVAGTLMATARGLIRIEEVPEYHTFDATTHEVSQLQVPSLNPETLAIEHTTASHFYDLGQQSVIHMECTDGYSLTGTPEHPIVILADGAISFRRIDEIQIGDVALLCASPCMDSETSEGEPKPVAVNPHLAYIMGAVSTPASSLTKQSLLQWTNKNIHILNNLMNHCEKVFDTESNKENVFTQNNQGSYILCDVSAPEQLARRGVSTERIPSALLYSGSESVLMYLMGLIDFSSSFEADNTAEAMKLTFASEQIARETQVLLLQFNLYPKRTEQLLTFDDVAVLELYTKHFKASCDHVDLLLDQPGWCAKVMKSNAALDARQAKHLANLREGLNSVCDASRIFTPIEPKLCVGKNRDEIISQLSDVNRFRTVKVVGLTKDKAAVYDVTVPVTHSFIANGFVNHNTLLAKAVAHETSATFLRIVGSELIQKYLGDGPKMVRELFRVANLNAPAIVFIDEIDAVGSKRYDAHSGGEREVQRTMLELLNQLDGFDAGSDVKVIMATNRLEALDPALIRPGRIDRKVFVPPPNKQTRRKIFAIHTARMTLSSNVSFEGIEDSELSGAEIKAICTEAGLIALRQRRLQVFQDDFVEGKKNVMWQKKNFITDALYV